MNPWLAPIIEAHRAHITGRVGLIVDVGSRDGDDAAELTAVLGGTAICVEARPEAAAVIRETHPTFTVIEAAASDHEGKAPFLVIHGDPGLEGSSSLNLERALTYVGEKTTIEVPTVRLADVLPAGRIDVLKIDVEGYSLEALAGLGDRIDDVQVAHIETETSERAPWREQANNHYVAQLMRARGFRLFALRYEWGPSIEDQTWVRTKTPIVEPMPS